MMLFVVSLVTLCVGCGSKSSPAGVVEECWKRLSKGEVRKAVELMDAAQDEVALYREMYEEQCSELLEAGGMTDFEVVSLSEGETDATVEAIVTLRNGQQIAATYSLTKRDGHWLISE